MSPRVVRVLPDVPALDREFDYLVPEPLGDQVRVGTIVRVDLHGRRVRGWVVADGVEPPPGVPLRPLARVTGHGPGPALIELARWAAWRWAGRTASLLRTASPPTAVRALPASPARWVPAGAAGGGVEPDGAAIDLLAAGGPSLLVLPPAADRLSVALAAAARGPALVLCPTAAMARAAAAGLRRAGVAVALHPDGWAVGAAGATVVGTRAAAWAPVGGLAAVVVFDEHDEAHGQERAPTWNGRDVALERAARAGVPCLLVSPCPSLEARGVVADRVGRSPVGARGWPAVVVADRRDEDPGRAGLLSPALVRLLGEGGRVLCVLNRTGRARLLACAACGEVARCERCDAAVVQPDEAVLRCLRCATERPVVCQRCTGTRLRTVRAGVARVRDDLAALLREPVVELGAAADPATVAGARVVVGTEAVLHQGGRADAVAFLDLDQELLAPRYRAAEQALALLARAARVVGAGRPGEGGRAGGRLLVQTRLPDHEVVAAAVRGDPTVVAEAEAARRRMLDLPPFTALATVSGPGAAALVAGLAGAEGVAVLGPSEGTWLVRAPDHGVLADALGRLERPAERVRVAVDPLRI
ncbi:MAG: hypothetical protein AB7L84_16470 [Acidimicrobiia bacterium]